jgi:hypothetical protein
MVSNWVKFRLRKMSHFEYMLTKKVRESLLCYPKVGAPQIRCANSKSANLRTSVMDLPKMWHVADLRFVGTNRSF